ncbi:S-4TM family putative pore-forming effector [Azohydromonas lata]|uniref:S-4TM family putative pore-forming effector n=1 Tax=Azohydromonas lata TaxID=45677 RepID=A0ABU5IB71_9BURK|nr:S-4TM family putative pore-forming effector [Azohydromonas lata]MDZ5455795.1 S-4TM family putative pore-forming effector [Azohydromonas lata]
MNSIIAKQNEDRMLSLVRARRRIYKTAKRYQGAVVLMTLLLPVISLAVANFAPAAKAYVAVTALLFSICDVVFMDRWNKGLMKDAAKLQEEFDCEVLAMRRNEFVVGAGVDPEEIYQLSVEKLNADGESQLRNWYPVAVGKVPLHVARILCQRENLLYDGKVRKTYGRLLTICLIALVVVLFIYSLAAELKLDAFVLTVLVPAMPVVNWAIRELFRQKSTVETLDRLKAESEKLWKKVVEGMSETDAAERSRELQDAIYNHRVASPLVFDFLYRYRRASLEAQMNAGAEHLVDGFLKKKAAAI